jgi:hypothetical protein
MAAIQVDRASSLIACRFRFRQFLLEQLLSIRPHSSRLALRQLQQRRQEVMAELFRCLARQKRRQMVDRNDTECRIPIAGEEESASVIQKKPTAKVYLTETPTVGSANPVFTL